jgi:hypothetical protein
MQNKISLLIINLCIAISFYGCSEEIDPCSLTNEQAIQEIEKIEHLLNDKSPYMNINYRRVKKSLDSLSENIRKTDNISKYDLSIKLKDILAELGDRHFSLEYIGNCIQDDKYYLPFSIAPWGESMAVALIKQPKITFSFYLEEYPFLSKINGQNIIDFIEENDSENKYAPKFSKLALGVEKLNEIYRISEGLKIGDKIDFTFLSKDHKSDTILTLDIVKSRNKWKEIDSYLIFNKDNDRFNKLLFRQYDNDITYIKIPEMYSYSKDEDYFQWLQKKMDTVRGSNALIIDLRNNPGGNRDLIDFFSNYLIAPKTFEVANLSRYKGDLSDDTKNNLSARRLYPYEYFKDKESKQAINNFNKNFSPSIGIDEKLYSEYYYMMLNSNDKTDSYHYDNQIYILTNEMTFSAASVFASSFKGVENIKLVGVGTDGSSGLSKTYELKNSELQIRLSHMLSYQKNGELFDGVGTSPDIEIHRSFEQILGKEDAQLNTLLEIINTTIQ